MAAFKTPARHMMFAVSITLGLFACSSGLTPSTTDGDLDYTGPGSEAWGDDDITCGDSSDCLAGEVCEESICQVEKCAGDLADTVAPLGNALTFFQENEVAFADSASYEGAYWIDGYDAGNSVSYDHSWEIDDNPINDIAGGDVLGVRRQEAYVAAVQGQAKLFVVDDEESFSVSLEFVPEHVAVGDIDGDGVDEVVASDGGDETAICDLDDLLCDYYSFNTSGLYTHDVAVGDIDADGYAEPVLLIEVEGYRYLYGMNLDAKLTGQVADWWGYTDGGGDNPARITIGDTDGDLVDEVLGLWDNGYWGLFDDEIISFAAIDGDDGGEFYSYANTEIDGYTETLDVAVADTDLDELDDLIVLADGAQIVAYRATSSGSLSRRFAETLDVSVAPNRIAMADHDGDAPKARLVGEPERCEGGVMPIMVMTLPPYHRDHSAYPSSVSYGDGESTSESMSDTVSMGLSVDVGVGADFWGIFGGKLSSKVSSTVSQTSTQTSTLYMGNRFRMEADPDLYGPNYGGVVLAWGCFDAYTYAIDDPANHIGEVDDEQFVMVTPSGGGVSLWSSARYNAMAEALGSMPTLDIPWTVGDVSSYPSTPTQIDGQPIDEDDMLFTSPTEYTVSDVGDVSWWNSVSESATNSESMGVDLGVSASITVGGVTVGGGASYGWGSSYSLTVGSTAIFGGTLPPIADDPNTPEDEYTSHAYQATPYVYVHRYDDASGNPAAFYAMTYTVNE